jgi:hypothetical protein
VHSIEKMIRCKRGEALSLLIIHPKQLSQLAATPQITIASSTSSYVYPEANGVLWCGLAHMYSSSIFSPTHNVPSIPYHPPPRLYRARG